MTTLSIQPPFPLLTDIDGQPLENGYIWIGVANLPPIGNPIAVYWDAALTQPAALPVRTAGGYPMNNGTPGRLYVGSDYSILVQNRNGSVIYSAPQATERYSDPVITGVSSAEVSFLQAGSGAVVRTAQSKMREVVSVLDFGADPTGVANSSVAFSQAIGTGKIVYAPAGTYRLNVTIANKTVLYGDGSNKTFLSPFNSAVAVLTYNTTSPYWTYHSEIRDVCFLGSSKTGVGFTFGTTDVANYAAGMEYSNNVRFYGVRFEQLNKGVSRQFGNIGCSFYDCDWTNCYYGVYSLNNKFGGDAMHPGNAYFFSGHFEQNDCAIYIHNTADGFYGFVFNGTIFEQNAIACFVVSLSQLQPTQFNAVGAEFNGTLATHTTYTNITLDTWLGSVKGTASYAAKSYIFEGDLQSVNYTGGGIVTDISLTATNSRVLIDGSRVESETGYNGLPMSVASPTSSIVIRNPTTFGGLPKQSGIAVLGNVFVYPINIGSTNINARTWLGPARNCLRNAGGSSGISVNNTTGQPYVGSFSGTGSIASDGTLFATSNEFNIPFTSASQFVLLSNSAITTVAGYYVATVDIKLISGSPTFYIWNQAANQFGGLKIPTVDTWYTMTCLGYSSGGQSLWFDIGGTNASANFRIGPLQIRRFATLIDAQSFIESMAYIQP